MLVRSLGLAVWYKFMKLDTDCFNASHLVPEVMVVPILPERSNTSTTSIGCEIITSNAPVLEVAGLEASATTKLNVNEPVAVGVPVIVTFRPLETLTPGLAGNSMVTP